MFYKTFLSYRQFQNSGMLRTDPILIWDSNIVDVHELLKSERSWEDLSDDESKSISDDESNSNSASNITKKWTGCQPIRDLGTHFLYPKIPFEGVRTVKVSSGTHKVLFTKECIRVWRYQRAPKCLKLWHFCFGGDEDWVALVPPKYADMNIQWLESGTTFGCCDVSRNQHPSLGT